jgi:hypothetical protein
MTMISQPWPRGAAQDAAAYAPCDVPDEVLVRRARYAAMIAPTLQDEGFAHALTTAYRLSFARWRVSTGQLSEVMP